MTRLRELGESCPRKFQVLHAHCVEGHGDGADENVRDGQRGDEEVGRLSNLAVHDEAD